MSASILVGLFLSVSAMAKPQYSDIQQLIESSAEAFLSIHGVNGVGAGRCDSKTGAGLQSISTPQLNSEWCLHVTTSSPAGALRVRSLFPQGKRYQGSLVHVESIGEIMTQ